MWKRYWDLTAEPFLVPRPPFVALPGHGEAVARVVDAATTGEPFVVVRGAAGLGKSVVLRRAAWELTGPGKRVVLVSGAADLGGLVAEAAEGLGGKSVRAGRAADSWRSLTDALKLARWQKLRAVVLVDDAQALGGPEGPAGLRRLARVGGESAGSLTVVLAFQDGHAAAEGAVPWMAWGPACVLEPLTFAETESYLAARLAAVGRAEPAFSAGALRRLQAVSGGAPRALDRLATLALRSAAAARGDRVTTADVEGAARDCLGPDGLADCAA